MQDMTMIKINIFQCLTQGVRTRQTPIPEQAICFKALYDHSMTIQDLKWLKCLGVTVVPTFVPFKGATVTN